MRIGTFKTIERSLALGVMFGFALLGGCAHEPSSPSDSGLLVSFAKATSTGISVSSATPDSATQDTTLDVVINGSGFVSGSTAAWQLAGVSDPRQVRTNSTRYVNSRQLIANITISAGATVAKWDVAVYAGAKGGVGTEMFAIKPTDPKTTWMLPLADATLAVRSDHAYSDGTYSVYATGVCNVTGTIFSSTPSSSGDATIQTTLPTNGKCGRVLSLHYPDGVVESVAFFSNLNLLESNDFAIPIGATVSRRLVINPGVITHNPSRCGRLYFGVGPLGEKGIGSDSVLVTRQDASTWQVQSRPAPNDRALCETNGQIYSMPLKFLIVSSFPLH